MFSAYESAAQGVKQWNTTCISYPASPSESFPADFHSTGKEKRVVPECNCLIEYSNCFETEECSYCYSNLIPGSYHEYVK